LDAPTAGEYQHANVQGVVRDTGEVFDALSERDGRRTEPSDRLRLPRGERPDDVSIAGPPSNSGTAGADLRFAARFTAPLA